jgi:hypothetical protein
MKRAKVKMRSTESCSLSLDEVYLSSAAEIERYLKLGQWAGITRVR